MMMMIKYNANKNHLHFILSSSSSFYFSFLISYFHSKNETTFLYTKTFLFSIICSDFMSPDCVALTNKRTKLTKEREREANSLLLSFFLYKLAIRVTILYRVQLDLNSNSFSSMSLMFSVPLVLIMRNVPLLL